VINKTREIVSDHERSYLISLLKKIENDKYNMETLYILFDNYGRTLANKFNYPSIIKDDVEKWMSLNFEHSVLKIYKKFKSLVFFFDLAPEARLILINNDLLREDLEGTFETLSLDYTEEYILLKNKQKEKEKECEEILRSEILDDEILRDMIKSFEPDESETKIDDTDLVKSFSKYDNLKERKRLELEEFTEEFHNKVLSLKKKKKN